VLSRDTLQLAEACLPNLPLVYTMVVLPYAFASPRNAGCVLIQPDLEKQFAILTALLPGRKKMLVIYNPAYSAKIIAEARALSGRHGFELLPVAVENKNEVMHYLDGVESYSADVIWSVLDRTVSQPEVVRKTIEVAHAKNLPFIGQTVFHVKAGALAAVCADYTDIGRQCAQLAAKIHAYPAAEQKVETPRKIIVYLNAAVKKSLNLTISPALPDVCQVE